MEVIEGDLAGLPTSDPWWHVVILIANCERPTATATRVALSWPYFVPDAALVPGGFVEHTGIGPTFVTLAARKYAGLPRQDEDTVGDRLDWLIECLNMLGDRLGDPARVAVEWLRDPEERKAIEEWGGAGIWVTPPRPKALRALPPTRQTNTKGS